VMPDGATQPDRMASNRVVETGRGR
jgi:hypothetical protein